MLLAGLLLGLLACGNESQNAEAGTEEPAAATDEAEGGLVKELTWDALTLKVQAIPSDGRASLNNISITGSVGETMIQPVVISETDPMIEALLADLNGDNTPEVYCFTSGAGSGAYGTVIAYALLSDGAVSQINVQSMDETMQEGYMGHDSFAIEEGRLVRSFPIYNEGDANSNPTGGIRRVIYALEAGEASLQLIPVAVE